jgi:hypothetical protein
VVYLLDVKVAALGLSGTARRFMEVLPSEDRSACWIYQ